MRLLQPRDLFLEIPRLIAVAEEPVALVHRHQLRGRPIAVGLGRAGGDLYSKVLRQASPRLREVHLSRLRSLFWSNVHASRAGMVRGLAVRMDRRPPGALLVCCYRLLL